MGIYVPSLLPIIDIPIGSRPGNARLRWPVQYLRVTVHAISCHYVVLWRTMALACQGYQQSFLAHFRNASHRPSVSGASAAHGKVRRKRTYVFPRVFIVDDEHVIASTLAAILKLHGYSADFFTSPRDALTAAQLEAPDLLISDVVMPGYSGVDLAIQMKAQYPACKILLFSGQTYTRDLLKDARSLGHDFPLLAKPVPPSEMLAKIAALVPKAAPVFPVFPQHTEASCMDRRLKRQPARDFRY